MKPVITLDLLARLKSKRGGYTREALQILGIQWPPKRGWRKALVREAKANEAKAIIEGTTTPSFTHIDILNLRFKMITAAERIAWLESQREEYCFLCGQPKQLCSCAIL